MNPFEKLYGAVVPNPEERWERGGAQMRQVEIDKGRYEDVPFFDLEASLKPKSFGLAIDNNGVVVGDYESFSVTTSDGIDRTARLYIPRDGLQASEEIIHADTAWMTTITGHNDYAAASFVGMTGHPVIVVGAEHGTNRSTCLDEVKRVPETLARSQTISLAKSAQSSQLITSAIRDRFGLSNKIIKTGESRGAMLTPGHFPYAAEYGNEIVYSDITAPCVPEKLLSQPADWLRLARWPGSEAIGTLAVGLSLAKKKVLQRQVGTVTLNPNFMVSNLTGVGPALFSGEAGRFTKWMPKETALYVSTFKNDTVSRPDVWRELYDEHPNVYIREHKGGTHMTLASDEVLASKAARINQAMALRALRGEAISPEEWQEIFTARTVPSRYVVAA